MVVSVGRFKPDLKNSWLFFVEKVKLLQVTRYNFVVVGSNSLLLHAC